MMFDLPESVQLIEVRIERFKASFNPKTPIEFRPLNAIIGRNGAGKSTVLEALQWVDTALRTNIRAACGRYAGIHELINLRSTGINRRFTLGFKWQSQANTPYILEYVLKVGEDQDKRTPIFKSEHFWYYPELGTGHGSKIELITSMKARFWSSASLVLRSMPTCGPFFYPSAGTGPCPSGCLPRR